MQLIRKDRLVLSDRDHIRALLKDLSTSRTELATDAVELGIGARVKIKTIKENYFLIETDRIPNEVLSIPLSSWRLIADLEGVRLSITTVSLARVDTQMFALLIPEEIVSGNGRRHYRVMAVGHESFQITLHGENGNEQADIVEASFSGLKAKLQKPNESTLKAGNSVSLIGRQRGIMFREQSTVSWRSKDEVGIVIEENAGELPIEDRPWSHVVRRMAYDQFMKHLRPVN